jgi:hypothetical protein
MIGVTSPLHSNSPLAGKMSVMAWFRQLASLRPLIPSCVSTANKGQDRDGQLHQAPVSCIVSVDPEVHSAKFRFIPPSN